MLFVDAFSLEKINDSNFPLRTFRCNEKALPIMRFSLSSKGWKVISETRSKLYADIIVKVAKKNFVAGLTPEQREKHGITTTQRNTFE